MTEDIYWKSMLKDLSYGITPFGVYIENDTICNKFKGKEFMYSFRDKSDEDIYKNILHLFKTRLQLYSKLDVLHQQKNIDTVLDFSMYKEWKDIKKKNIKETFIRKYVLDLKDKYKLNLVQAKKLLRLILVSISFQIITNHDITYSYENGITNIKGIDINKLKIPIDNIVFELSYESIEKKNLQMLWEKI